MNPYDDYDKALRKLGRRWTLSAVLCGCFAVAFLLTILVTSMLVVFEIAPVGLFMVTVIALAGLAVSLGMLVTLPQEMTGRYTLLYLRYRRY